MERSHEDFEKTRHGHVWSQISGKLQVGFALFWICKISVDCRAIVFDKNFLCIFKN